MIFYFLHPTPSRITRKSVSIAVERPVWPSAISLFLRLLQIISASCSTALNYACLLDAPPNESARPRDAAALLSRRSNKHRGNPREYNQCAPPYLSYIRSATPADRLMLYFDLIACEIHFLCFFFVYFYLFCLFSFFCKLGMSIIKRNAMPQAASSSYTVIANDQRTESKKETV